MPHLDDAVHVDTRQVDVVGVKFAGRYQLFDLSNTDLARHRREWVEVARCTMKLEVAVSVASARVDEGEIGDDRLFQDVFAGRSTRCERAHILRLRCDSDATRAVVATRKTAFGNLSANSRLRVERSDSRSSGAQLFGQGSLRGQFQLKFAGQELALKLLVLSDVRRGHLSDATRGKKHPQPPVIHSTVVAHDAELTRALREDRLNQGDGIAGKTEPTYGDARPRGYVGDRFCCGLKGLIDHASHSLVLVALSAW